MKDGIRNLFRAHSVENFFLFLTEQRKTRELIVYLRTIDQGYNNTASHPSEINVYAELFANRHARRDITDLRVFFLNILNICRFFILWHFRAGREVNMMR